MVKYVALSFLLFSPACFVNAQSIIVFNHLLTGSNQVLYVTTSSVNDFRGTMVLFERKNYHKRWMRVDSFTVVVGRAGLAKDAQPNISFNNIMPVKREGDGRSPAGIFRLGDVFSYHALSNLRMPFILVDTNFYCVDDATSAYYNTLIVNDTAKSTFNSFEYMRRKDDLYEYGIWVLYNNNPVNPGSGSCIFIHVWNNEHSGTAGCTAMSKENILKLIYWLNKKKNPVLLQVVKGSR